ncbi:MAG: flagellar hook-basal body complex protein FliE [Lachnospiraceae bacterium]|nr:flagellar hook-basal body complex protein FliE [Lachnospiraceae bacterium]
MSINAINGLDSYNTIFDNNTAEITTDNTAAFDNLFNSAIEMYKETDSLQNAAEQAEIDFSLGYATSTHDLAIAQQKANISLQYTVKVTNKFLEAYKELMNMQI